MIFIQISRATAVVEFFLAIQAISIFVQALILVVSVVHFVIVYQVVLYVTSIFTTTAFEILIIWVHAESAVAKAQPWIVTIWKGRKGTWKSILMADCTFLERVPLMFYDLI